jgi:hypothetical protein
MNARPQLAVLLALVSLALAPSAALAGTTTRWERLTAQNDPNTFTPGFVRTSGGVLHVAFLRQEAGNTNSMRHVAISARGKVGPSVDMLGNWNFLANPDLVPVPGGGLRVFFGGIHTTNPGEPNDEMNTATAGSAGDVWALQPGSISNDEQGAADAGATTAADGTPLVSWSATLGVFVHRGAAAGPNSNLQTALGGCCAYSPDLARDRSGRIVAAWFSSASGKEGVFAQDIDATSGAPVGGAVRMPGSATQFGGAMKSIQIISRTPITSRPGHDGFYVAYPAGYPAQNRVLLWRVGAASSKTIVRARTVAHDQVGLAAAPDGRLWVFWSEKQGSRYRIVVTRSDKDVTAFGERVVLKPPAGSVDDFHLLGDAQQGRLDLLGSFGTVSGNSTWHRQVLPGLTLKAKTKRLRSGGLRVTVTVRDAGHAVKGATVKAGGKRARTNRRGKAKLKLGSAPRRLSLSAIKRGFTTDKAKVKVKPKRRR